MSTAKGSRGETLLLTLSIVCAVLLITTIALGVSTLLVSSTTATQTAPKPAPTMAPGATEKPDDANRVVQGREVTVVSDLEFGYFFMSRTDAHGYTSLYSQIRNTDPKQAITVYFDVSLYDDEGTLVSRWPTSSYLLPDQVTLFDSTLAENMLDVASISVEQTGISLDPPVMTGTVKMTEARGGDGGVVEGSFTSSLSAPDDYAQVAIVGTVDGEVFALCADYVEIPANDTFTARCTLEPTSRNTPEPVGDLPDDTEITAFYLLDIPR